MKILVTGASGFVGRSILDALLAGSVEATGGWRRGGDIPQGVPGCLIDPESPAEVVARFDVVVHAAGVAHLRPGAESDLLFEQGNSGFTRNLVDAVAETPARALLHISSIAARKAESSFGKSKREAEGFVESLQGAGKLGVNLRPPLIYGAGAKGNWAKVIRLAQLPLSLPFRSVDNARSYLGIDDLCAAVFCFLEHYEEAEKTGTYEIADMSEVSLREVVSAIRLGLGRGAGLLPFPPACLDRPLRLLGCSGMAEGLFGNLHLDSTAFANTFEWMPNPSTLESMADSVRNLTEN